MQTKAAKKKSGMSMNTRIAEKSDIEILSQHDKHIRKEGLESVISLGRVIVAENILFLLEEYRNSGYGKAMLSHWEKQMKEKGYKLVMTSSLANEEAQHFYRKLGYADSGALLLPEEPLEIIFCKRI